MIKSWKKFKHQVDKKAYFFTCISSVKKFIYLTRRINPD
jgi:hypothetical protein